MIPQAQPPSAPQPFAAGPDGAQPPYVYWTVKNGNNLVGGASFEIQAWTTGDEGGWGPSVPVQDCTSAPCTGLDRDPNAGEFLVSSSPGAITITNGARYQARPVTAPSGSDFSTTKWVPIPGSNNNGTGWSNATYNFGNFALTTSVSTVIVPKGSLRTSNGKGVLTPDSSTVGVRFGLYQNQNDTTPLATCEITTVTLSQGCVFTNVSQKGQLWVGELAPAPGSPAETAFGAPLTKLTTGSSTFTDRTYRYQTPNLTGTGQTYTVPQLSSSNAEDSSSGYVANRLANPQLGYTCSSGINVALVMDLSGSVAAAGAADTLQSAAKGFVTSLKGSGSKVALFSFGDTSPRQGTQNQATPLSVDNPTDLAALNSRIDNYRQYTVTNQGTNWDAGLYQAALGAQNNHYDLVLVLTDGNPTFSVGTNGSTDGAGYVTTFRELERAMFSANLIKKQGSRVMTVGIGDNLSSYNLSSISGNNGYTAGASLNQIDYTTTNWSNLQGLLGSFAQGLSCKAEITVQKLAQSLGSSTASPAGGWTFAASATGASSIAPQTSQQTSSPGGTATWNLSFANPSDTASVAFTETQQTGWNLAGVVCTINGQPANSSVTGTKVSVGQPIRIGDKVKCTYTNVQNPPSATVAVDKQWIVNGTSYNQGQQPAGLTAALYLNPAGTGTGNPAFGQQRTGFTVGDTVTVGETTGIDQAKLPGCTLTSATLKGTGIGNGEAIDLNAGNNFRTPTVLSATTNAYTITNVVTCQQTLTLTKSVGTIVGGYTAPAQPTDWTLTAAPAAGGNPVIAHPTPATGTVAVGTYQLGESGGPATYVPTSAGWTCTLTGTSTNVPVQGSQVTIGLGQAVTCGVTNATAELTLLKHVQNGTGISASDWNLTATPDALNGLAASTVPGSEDESASNSFLVKPGHTYTLSEKSKTQLLAYWQLRLEKQNANGTWSTVNPGLDGVYSITAPQAGEHVVYRFVNTNAPSITLPLTGGMAQDLFVIAGSGLLVLTAAAAAWRRRREQSSVE